jgi:guanine nucleotide-binding protein subunit alpha
MVNERGYDFLPTLKVILIYFKQTLFFRFVKKKFEESYFQNTAPDSVDRVFKIYRTTALDQKVVKKTFKLVDETLRRRNLFEAGLL